MGVFMNATLISLLVIFGLQVKAEQVIAQTAPTYANLSAQSISRNMTLVNPLFKNTTSAYVTFNSKSLNSASKISFIQLVKLDT